jgi:hypothetical protein
MRLFLNTALFLAGVAALGQTLTPREIFYGQHRASHPRKTAAATPPKEASAPVPDEPRPAEPASAAARPDYVTAKQVVAEPRPLAMRYSVRKLDSGNYTEIDADSTFHAGDHISLGIETNDSGYLYVVAQGSSGRWNVAYPAEAVSGSNRVERGRTYKIPPGPDEVLTFDSRAGTERLFVVLTRKPVPDLEKLIYSLQNERSKPPEQAQTMLAQNFQPIDDGVVQSLRTTYARDLLIEKVGDAKPAPTPEAASVPPDRLGEKAVYVVNMSAGDNARLVADIALTHQ